MVSTVRLYIFSMLIGGLNPVTFIVAINADSNVEVDHAFQLVYRALMSLPDVRLVEDSRFDAPVCLADVVAVHHSV